MAVNQLKTLFEQQITNGSNTLHTMKPPPPMRVPKSAAHASRSSQPQPVNKHPRVQDEKIASPTRASPDYQKANSLPRTAKLSASNSLHMAHRERLEGISGKMTQPVRLNNSSSRPKSPNCIKSNRVVNSHVGALQRSGSAESLTSSNDSDDTRPGRDKLSKLTLRTSSDEDLSLKMAAVGSESPPWGRAVLKKPVSASVDTEPLPQAPPAEGADYLLAAKKALRRTNIDVVLTSTPPLSPSLDGTTPVVRTSAASPNAPSGDDENAVELADEVTELGSVGGRIEKFKSQVSTSSLSEQAEEEWDVSSDAGMDDWVFLQKDRGSVDSSGSPFVEENSSSPDLEPPSERREPNGTAHEGECAAAQTPAMSVGPPDPAKVGQTRMKWTMLCHCSEAFCKGSRFSFPSSIQTISFSLSSIFPLPPPPSPILPFFLPLLPLSYPASCSHFLLLFHNLFSLHYASALVVLNMHVRVSIEGTCVCVMCVCDV